MIGYVGGVAFGLVLLALAGDQFIVGVSRVASALRIRPIVIGAVVGGLGTSFPELAVSGLASVRGQPALAIGNLVGSIIANVSLALAVAALVTPLRVDSRSVRREAPLSVAAVLLFALLLPGGLGFAKGLVLIVALAAALGALLLNARVASRRDALGLEVREFFELKGRRPTLRELARATLALALMLAGAELLIRSASGLASRLGLVQGFVGLTIVAVGTSAPGRHRARRAHGCHRGGCVGADGPRERAQPMGGGAARGRLRRGPAIHPALKLCQPREGAASSAGRSSHR